MSTAPISRANRTRTGPARYAPLKSGRSRFRATQPSICPSRRPEPQQLPPRHHPVLVPRQPPDFRRMSNCLRIRCQCVTRRRFYAPRAAPLRREPQRRALGDGAVPAGEGEGAREAAEGRVGGEVLLDLRDRRPAAEAGERRRPASRRRGRRRAASRARRGRRSRGTWSVQGPIPGIRARRRSPARVGRVDAAARRPRARTDQRQRPRRREVHRGELGRGDARRSPRARARRAAARGRRQAPPRPAGSAAGRPSGGRSAAGSRPPGAASISCSVTAQASASHGHGRRRGRSQGRWWIASPISGSPRNVAGELGQVVVDAEREAHPLDRELERLAPGGLAGVDRPGAKHDPLASRLPGVDDDAARRRRSRRDDHDAPRGARRRRPPRRERSR